MDVAQYHCDAYRNVQFSRVLEEQVDLCTETLQCREHAHTSATTRAIAVRGRTTNVPGREVAVW
jgi:hypothetical protein